MDIPPVASRDEWLAARKDLLAQEKQASHAKDVLDAARRALPMIEIDKEYSFAGPRRAGWSVRARTTREPQGRSPPRCHECWHGGDAASDALTGRPANPTHPQAARTEDGARDLPPPCLRALVKRIPPRKEIPASGQCGVPR